MKQKRNNYWPHYASLRIHWGSKTHEKRQHCTQSNTQINGMYPVSSDVNLPLSSDYICISVCQPLCLYLVELPSFTFWLSCSMIPSSCSSLLHFASDFHTDMCKTLIQWKGSNMSLQASKRLWKYFLNVHIVRYFIYCIWMNTRI